jgi:radical SAM superfamily enzyme YgiQ (UPF0313 family)
VGSSPTFRTKNLFLSARMSSQKNILFINPWIYDFTAYDYWLKPLGLLYIASIVRESTNCQVSFLDCLDRFHPLLDRNLKKKPDGRGAFQKEEVPKPPPLKDMPRRYSRYGIPLSLFLAELESVPRPDLVLLTCTMTYWYPGVQKAVELVRQEFGDIPIVLGGNYATLMPGHAQSFSGADSVVEGAGENQILPLINKILGDGTADCRGFDNIEELPPPAFDLLRNWDGLPLVTSRGCPFKCSFCAVPLLTSRFEQRSPASVIAEVQSHYQRFQARNFAFFDDALLFNKHRHIIPILKGVSEKGMPLTFHTPNGLQIREIDFEMASILKEAHVQSIFLSQESFDERLLARACPKVSPGDLDKAIVNLEKAGYRRPEINVYLIVGLPGQDVLAVKQSILRVRELGARPRLTYFSPVPGTPEWENLVNQGYLPRNADPLLHNKLTFPYLWGNISAREFDDLRNMLIEDP